MHFDTGSISDLHSSHAHIAVERVVLDLTQTPDLEIFSQYRCQGAPISMPSALASFDRAITQPSLLDSTTTGSPR